MIEAILHGIQKGIDAATPWLVGTAIGFFVLWLIILCYKCKPFAKALNLSNASKWPKKAGDAIVWEHSDFKNAAFFSKTL